MADNQGKGEDIGGLFNRLHLLDRLHDVLAANGNIEEKLANEISDMRAGNASDQALWSKYAYLEQRIGNVSRQGMLAMVLSWLEAALDLIADDRAVDGSEILSNVVDEESSASA